MGKMVWGLLLVATLASRVDAATCTPTGFFRDGSNMTAALINPAVVSGTVDATGCHIAVYYGPGSSGVIKGADIFGANYFGVMANGDYGDIRVDILNSRIHGIGEVPHNGSQHGVAVYLRAFTALGTVTGKIAGNRIEGYQKGGIVANGIGTQMLIDNNIVAGDGHVTFIAMNGIQIGYGATASVMRNTVSGNSYIGYPDTSAASGGILVVGGAGYGICPDGNDCPYTTDTQIVGNRLTNNDVGVYLSNLEADYSAPWVPTNVKAVNNVISSDECFNTSYQAAVSDVGNNDKIITNRISGDGYGPSCTTVWNSSGAAIDASTDFTNRPKVHANK